MVSWASSCFPSFYYVTFLNPPKNFLLHLSCKVCSFVGYECRVVLQPQQSVGVSDSPSVAPGALDFFGSPSIHNEGIL